MGWYSFEGSVLFGKCWGKRPSGAALNVGCSLRTWQKNDGSHRLQVEEEIFVSQPNLEPAS